MPFYFDIMNDQDFCTTNERKLKVVGYVWCDVPSQTLDAV